MLNKDFLYTAKADIGCFKNYNEAVDMLREIRSFRNLYTAFASCTEATMSLPA